jgi:sugar lactone lactonase YvrE
MTSRLSAGFFLSLLFASFADAHPGPGIVVNAKGEVYFVDPFRSRIMKFDAAGKMTVFVESKEGKNLSHLHHLIFDKRGNLYSVSDEPGSTVWKITPKAEMTAVYTPADRQDKLCLGVNGFPFTIDDDRNLYFVPGSPPNDSRIYKMSSDGKVTDFAGGARGHADGKRDRAQFGLLYTGCFAWGPKGELYLTDTTSVRKIAADGTVTTIAGGPDGGYADGAGREAKFDGAHGVTCDTQGNLYVAEHSNRRIRKITPYGNVTTLAGSGRSGSDDGPALKATFKGPVGIAVSREGTIYVLDYSTGDPGPTKVRKISRDGNVSTIASVDRP